MTTDASEQCLKFPWQRDELILELEDLAAPDLAARWDADREKGWIVGIDQTVHFLFDDHEFSAAGVGFCLNDANEAVAVEAVKAAIEDLMASLPRTAADADYLAHGGWERVRETARVALGVLKNG